MRNWMTVSTLAMAAMLSAANLAAQTPAAKAPAGSATPDLSGVWLGRPNQWSFSKEALPMKPEAEDSFKYNTVDWKNPSGPGRKELDPFIVSCAPPGVPRVWLTNPPFEIIQQPNR